MPDARNVTYDSKMMPTANEAERSVLGCLLLDKDAFYKVGDLLEVDDFYHDHHQYVYSAIVTLAQKAQPIDMVTVATQLEADGKLDLVGGPELLAEVQNEVPLPTHIFQYAQLVKHRSTLRRLIRAGTEVAELGYQADKPAEELLEAAEKRIFSISQTFLKDRFVHLKEILNASYEKFAEIHENPELATKNRIPTGLRDLDQRVNGGFNPSDLVIVAARPSMGKTALALEFAQHAAVNQGKKVGIMSLEMSKEQLVERMFCAQLEIDSWKLQKGKLSESDFDRMGPVMDRMGSAPIYIDDSMGSSLVELRAKVRRLQMEQGLDMLLIDYLQLMSVGGSSGFASTNRVQEISEISRSLKQLARELHIPVVALSQLSRGVEARDDKRPRLSDLRDSGAIEQDADVVMMLYRDDYYNPESDQQNQLEVNVIKHRNGSVGKEVIFFDRARMKFADLEKGMVNMY